MYDTPPPLRRLPAPALRAPSFGPAVGGITRVRVLAESVPSRRNSISWPHAFARALGIGTMAGLILVSTQTAFAAERPHCATGHVLSSVHRQDAVATYRLLVSNRKLRCELRSAWARIRAQRLLIAKLRAGQAALERGE